MEGLNCRKIRKNSKKVVFGMGAASWLSLALVCGILSFVGGTGSSSALINLFDRMIGFTQEDTFGNVSLLKEYILQEEWFATNPLLSHDLVLVTIDGLSGELTWLINLLAANMSYFVRNSGEVWGLLMIASIVSGAVRFFIQNALVVGKCRYLMERRFQQRILLRRIAAPYHLKYLPNIIWVIFRTNLQLALWWLTIVGGFIKLYQYRMVPYILAENPQIACKDAITLSKKITHGFKWRMFLLDLSYWYLLLLRALPVADVLFAIPIEISRDTEIYMELRRIYRSKEEVPYLIERAFDGETCWEQAEHAAPVEYVLKDIIPEENEKNRIQYRITDIIVLFFTFCCIGWAWEVVLHLVQHHEIVNRGTMYGPWLPIYGVGGVVCILLLDRIKGNLPKTILMIMLTAGVLEFFASWGLDFFLNASYWNYDDMAGNINGRICLAGLIAFAIGGSLAIYFVGPNIRLQLRRMSPRVRNSICIALCLLFAVDLVCCLIFGMNSGAGVGNVLS